MNYYDTRQKPDPLFVSTMLLSSSSKVDEIYTPETPGTITLYFIRRIEIVYYFFFRFFLLCLSLKSIKHTHTHIVYRERERERFWEFKKKLKKEEKQKSKMSKRSSTSSQRLASPCFPSSGSSIRESYLRGKHNDANFRQSIIHLHIQYTGARPIKHERDDPLPMGVSPELLQRHEKYMRRLRKDREGLEMELIQQEKAEKMTTDPKLVQDLKKLNTEIDTYVKNIEDTRKRIRMLETLIEKCRERQPTQTLSRGGVKVTRDNNEMMQKKISAMEKRLEKLLQRFNRKIAQNKELRQRIDRTRGERATFGSIFQKLETSILGFEDSSEETNTICRELSDMLSRERADLESKRIESERKTEHFEQQWKHLHTELEDAKLNHELDTENLRSTFVDNNRSVMMSKSTAMTMSTLSTLSSLNDSVMKERQQFFRFRQRHKELEKRNKVEVAASDMSLRDLHMKLQEFSSHSGEDPVIVLEQSEDEQYRVFVRITELQKQIQDEISSVKTWKKRIEELLPEKHRAMDTLIRQLEQKRATTRRRIEASKNRTVKMSQEIDEIGDEVFKLLNKIIPITSSADDDELTTREASSTIEKLGKIEVMLRRLGIVNNTSTTQSSVKKETHSQTPSEIVKKQLEGGIFSGNGELAGAQEDGVPMSVERTKKFVGEYFGEGK